MALPQLTLLAETAIAKQTAGDSFHPEPVNPHPERLQPHSVLGFQQVESCGAKRSKFSIPARSW